MFIFSTTKETFLFSIYHLSLNQAQKESYT